jgi:NifB/MoaA-like Fe-S oxidoreductase
MDTITALTTVDFPSVFIIVCSILIGLKAVVSIFGWWIDKLGIETKWTRKQKEEHELLSKTANTLSEFQKQHNKDMDELNRKLEEDRQRFAEIQNSLTSSIKDIADNVADLNEKNTKYELADMRETLMSSYRFFANPHTNPRLEWTEMERHAFNEQIESYELLGGNDFMHTVVEPEMAKLIVIPMSDLGAVSRLWESRYLQND